MRLDRVELVIEVCEQHLTSTSSFGSAIEAYLTQQLIVTICAEIEQAIEDIIIKRARDMCGAEFESFVESCLGAVFRSIGSSEIAGLLNRFGADRKAQFLSLVDDRAKTAYDNIVINRHRIAHKSGSNLTFNEAVDSYRIGLSVIDTAAQVLRS